MVSGTQRSIGTLVAAALVVVLTLALEASPAAGASTVACRVTNTDSGETFARFQHAVKAARPYQRLVVRGTCHGSTFIDRSLVIQGVRSSRRDGATLDGDGDGRVLKVARRAEVVLRDLTIEGGAMERTGRRTWTGSGGGIASRGSLILRDVVVRDNRARKGGGIFNQGTLSLQGRSRISDNAVSNWGYEAAGVFNVGTFVMNDLSSVSGNHGTGVANHDGTVTMNDRSRISENGLDSDQWIEGGGVYNWGTFTMNDRSRIVRNQGTRGGGVSNDNSFAMNDSSRIVRNLAVDGGGVFNYSGFTMNDSSRISGNRVARSAWPYGTQRSDLKPRGGGVYNDWGHLTMNGSSLIRDNRSQGRGGGLWNDGAKDPDGSIPEGVVCGPAGNVTGNAPDDCVIR